MPLNSKQKKEIQFTIVLNYGTISFDLLWKNCGTMEKNYGTRGKNYGRCTMRKKNDGTIWKTMEL